MNITEADSDGVITSDDWIVDIGAFWAGVDSKVRLDGRFGNINKRYDLEDDLGLSDREALFNMSLYYTGLNKWIFGLEWFELQRDTQHFLEREIEWGEEIYPIGLKTDSFFDLNVFRLFVGYEIWDKPKYKVGVNLGVHGVGAKVGIAASATVGQDDNFGVSAETEAETGAILPLPNLGVWGIYRFSDKLIGSANLEAFGMSYDEYSGILWRTDLTLRYQATRNFSVGIGYSYFNVEVDMERRLWRGEMEFSYYGPKIFTYFTF